MNKASCLSLLSNAVTAWNIVEVGRIVESLRQRSEVIRDEDPAHMWPLARRHVVPHGKYRFRVEERPKLVESKVAPFRGRPD